MKKYQVLIAVNEVYEVIAKSKTDANEKVLSGNSEPTDRIFSEVISIEEKK